MDIDVNIGNEFLVVRILQKIAEFLQSLEFVCTNLYNIFLLFVLSTVQDNVEDNIQKGIKYSEKNCKKNFE
ncbi:hypothetical protein BpHYR1_031005 [Brachionus plicatilis]|uniref:Uncharacterized protein n=1 Tax=Brachionus plicatilis TaxID=10195 RepID=A0A3M7STY7_BRAPC|nr:hypothetical protein BpHYR1_031005 [Brachionus plicatilis]